jgi:tight adherence protein B
MDDPIITYSLFFVFLCVSLAIFAFYRYYAVDSQYRKAKNARLEALEKGTDEGEALRLFRQKRGLYNVAFSRRFPNLNKWMIQTGLDLLDMPFLMKVLGIFIAVFFLVLYFTQFQPYGYLSAFFTCAIGFILFLKRVRDTRIAKFEEQLPDALEIIVRSLRAGHPTQTAISLAARECPDPIGTEFGLVYDEMRHGLGITEALQAMSDRVGLRDLVYVEAAVAIHAQSGGSLAEIVGRLATLIRERFRLRQKVSALTSEGRASGIFLTLLPVGIVIAIHLINPTYYGEIYNEPMAHYALFLSVGLLFTGYIYIRYLLKFDF